METQWFVLYTKPGSEKKVSETLDRKKIDYYFPQKRVKANTGIRDILINKPLFPNYILVKVAEKKLAELKRARGIISVVYWLGSPVIINDYEVKLLRQFLKEHVNLTVQKMTPGGQVENIFDTSVTQYGPNVMTIETGKANVILPTLGYVLFAEVESSNLRLIPAKNIEKRSKLISYKFLSPVVSLNNFRKLNY